MLFSAYTYMILLIDVTDDYRNKLFLRICLPGFWQTNELYKHPWKHTERSSSIGIEHNEKKVEKSCLSFVNIFSNSCTHGIYYKNIQICYSCYNVTILDEVLQGDELTHTQLMENMFKTLLNIIVIQQKGKGANSTIINKPHVNLNSFNVFLSTTSVSFNLHGKFYHLSNPQLQYKLVGILLLFH